MGRVLVFVLYISRYPPYPHIQLPMGSGFLDKKKKRLVPDGLQRQKVAVAVAVGQPTKSGGGGGRLRLRLRETSPFRTNRGRRVI